MLSFIAASVPSANVMDKLGRISKQLDNLESVLGLERDYAGYGAGECADAVKIYCKQQGKTKHYPRQQKINFVTNFCMAEFCDEEDDPTYECNHVFPPSKCIGFQNDFCNDAGAFLEESGATFITMTAAECAKWSVKQETAQWDPEVRVKPPKLA